MHFILYRITTPKFQSNTASYYRLIARPNILDKKSFYVLYLATPQLLKLLMLQSILPVARREGHWDKGNCTRQLCTKFCKH